MRAKNGLLPFKPRIGRAPAWAQEQREWAAETQAFDKHRFPTKRFKGNALLEAGSLGLGIDERVVALGDFNGDQLCVNRVLL